MDDEIARIMSPGLIRVSPCGCLWQEIVPPGSSNSRANVSKKYLHNIQLENYFPRTKPKCKLGCASPEVQKIIYFIRVKLWNICIAFIKSGCLLLSLEMFKSAPFFNKINTASKFKLTAASIRAVLPLLSCIFMFAL